jgi:bifunctional enzyme CysN/CysC
MRQQWCGSRDCSEARQSTSASIVGRKRNEWGPSYPLDGDKVRGLNRHRGFTEAERVENVRRAAEVARLLVDAGLIVIGAFISPYRFDRLRAQGHVAPQNSDLRLTTVDRLDDVLRMRWKVTRGTWAACN